MNEVILNGYEKEGLWINKSFVEFRTLSYGLVTAASILLKKCKYTPAPGDEIKYIFKCDDEIVKDIREAAIVKSYVDLLPLWVKYDLIEILAKIEKEEKEHQIVEKFMPLDLAVRKGKILEEVEGDSVIKEMFGNFVFLHVVIEPVFFTNHHIFVSFYCPIMFFDIMHDYSKVEKVLCDIENAKLLDVNKLLLKLTCAVICLYFGYNFPFDSVLKVTYKDWIAVAHKLSNLVKYYLNKKKEKYCDILFAYPELVLPR